MPTLHIQTPSAAYPVIIDKLLHDERAQIQHHGKALLVSNPKIAGLYLHKILPKIRASEVFVCIVPDGEAHKTMRTIEQILECAFAHKLDRKSLMIALGGGVISDMVGFASGIYERGIEYISIPTTLLAQVDASVGGKCGVNNAYGKNLIGLFHQPKAVYIDVDFLSTLPLRELRAGLAEVVKVFACFDSGAFEKLEAESSAFASLESSLDSRALELLPFIQRSIEIKAQVVEQDERESGIRAALNYGHTFAHVIENLTDYREFLHGEAVGIGIRMANALSLELGIMSETESRRIDSLLDRLGLQQRYGVRDVKEFYKCFFLDKKSTNNTLRFVLARGIGGFELRDDVSKAQLYKVLEKFA